MREKINSVIEDINFFKEKYQNISKAYFGIINPISNKGFGESFADILNEMDSIYDKIKTKKKAKSTKRPHKERYRKFQDE